MEMITKLVQEERPLPVLVFGLLELVLKQPLVESIDGQWIHVHASHKTFLIHAMVMVLSVEIKTLPVVTMEKLMGLWVNVLITPQGVGM
tara:strand:+ start:132 stop:398 length:267 start_codon:yes stop_codon:yes gene_type:complete